jgi:nucleotide-binding universal stress UspA family protein
MTDMTMQQVSQSRSAERPTSILSPAASVPIAMLAAVGGAADDEAAIAVAADLARRHRSPVTVVNTFEPMPAAVMPRGYAGGLAAMRVWESVDDERKAVARRIQALVDEHGHRVGLSPDSPEGGVLCMAAPSSGCWATLMRDLPLVDLAILAQSSVSGDGPWVGPFGEAMMAARVPVYVARDTRSAAGRPAAIAWDGGFEAARAVRAALPLLREADGVAILQAPTRLEAAKAERADPERLRTWLALHGVEAETVLQVGSGKIGEGLLAAARDFGAALFVAGAYHHSRIEEALFGGATRSFLEAGDGLHLLVAH